MNRGLIEAGRQASQHPPSMALPRFMNRGLIEARPLIILCGDQDIGLPRFMNRGLIEAMQGRRLASGVRRLPRFMNRGLIEAIVHSGLTIRKRRYFPDS